MDFDQFQQIPDDRLSFLLIREISFLESILARRNTVVEQAYLVQGPLRLNGEEGTFSGPYVGPSIVPRKSKVFLGDFERPKIVLANAEAYTNLEGRFPRGFTPLARAMKEMMDAYRAISP